jgi:DNA-binding transcriptional MocR family regulator
LLQNKYANVRVQYEIRGETASAIAADIEGAIVGGRLGPGGRLPTVRALGRALGVSPTTVAAAYRTLRQRGYLSAEGRRGTRVSRRPPLPVRAAAAPVPAHLRNLADGNPDPALLPRLAPALARLGRRPRLYGEPTNHGELLALARRRLAAEGIPVAALAVVGGALDGIERVLQARLRPGDRVAVEDPGYSGVLDLVGALGLVAEPVAVDDAGPLPAEVERALDAGAAALIVTPRAQNPTGAALDERRARALRAVLDRHPGALVVEDDHAGPVAGAPALTLCRRRAHFAVVRSVSKSLGPDLRLAIVAGDPTTIARVEGRQQVGAGWVSHVLQGLVAGLWSDPATERRVRAAARAYATRRAALLDALAARGIRAHGRSGLNVWVPVPEEARAVTALADAGWAVRAGERYRLRSAPAVRVTVATLRPGEAERIAAALAAALTSEGLTAPA